MSSIIFIDQNIPNVETLDNIVVEPTIEPELSLYIEPQIFSFNSFIPQLPITNNIIPIINRNMIRNLSIDKFIEEKVARPSCYDQQ